MLEVKHLRKTFGDLVAVDDVSFTIEPGTIMGIIGQNGSGKTTIFRMILDFLTPEGNGEVLWNGVTLTDKVYNTVGYLPEERGLYEKMTIEQQIVYFAELRGMKKADIIDKIDEWMVRFNVKGKRTDKIKSLSKGNQQKVQLIATLIHEPKLVILDEPFSGLDPVNADFLKKGIVALKDKGSCVIFSSHNMNNVEEICDKLVMIHNGKQVLYGGIEEVRQSFGRTKLLIETPDWAEQQLATLEGVKVVKHHYAHQYLLELADETYGKAIFDQVTKGNYVPVFYQQAPTLEEIFKLKAGESHE
ncbi:ABC transporter ATP-binding protein [Globicatella sulfidifaciens]|uniref:ABC-2 type transport system ATP-binding protein n=1 Tax=Globicatella sulfidifaciens DSM 15739 TaxID=1121925 RepID=A0A1T4MB14_9LACT|nr:ABC transporter ATP-binding protein [Globicatella sulfidifaciens]SJZ64193.1 ABC-2 type transport system ATP-binding protein [Globicatella sulfidifaciens DSM 15739]